MELGQLVDYCIEYNNVHSPKDTQTKKSKGTIRKATQDDWDRLLG